MTSPTAITKHDHLEPNFVILRSDKEMEELKSEARKMVENI